MRVIAGSARGRILKAVPGMGTRPTTDKVKEAIFSMIGPYFAGGSVLDLFGGTGALGIEALSRGIDQAIIIDIDKGSTAIIQENLQLTQLTARAEVYRNDAVKAIKALAKRNMMFDLVFLDPPYKFTKADEIIELLEDYKLLNDQATIVVECDARHPYEGSIGSMHCKRHAEYGDTAVQIYIMNQDQSINQGGDCSE